MRIGNRVLFAAISIAAIVPALAAPVDPTMLQSYVGTWKGKGKLVGAERGTTSCKITFKESKQRMVFTGRCSTGLGSQSFNGTLAYNAAAKRFEASSKDGVVPGLLQGDALVFNMRSESTHGQANSEMTFGVGAIVIDFTIVDKDAATTTAHIAFAKT